MFQSLEKKDEKMLISYNLLRMIIGLLGITLPFILLLHNKLIGKCNEAVCSISHNYYSAGRDWFVALISIVAFFLFAYQGYDRDDRILSKLASLSAIGILLFPTSSSSCPGDCLIYAAPPSPVFNFLHFACAGIFFLILIVFCLRQFVQTGEEAVVTDEKKRRNLVYRLCGLIMILCIVTMAIDVILKGDKHYYFHEDIFFYAESIALIAFGISWLTKAEIFFPDEPEIQEMSIIDDPEI